MSSFGKWLGGELSRREWRQADLAHRAGLTNGTVSRIMKGSRRAGPEVCRALAAALDMPPEHVFRMAGLLPPDPAPVQEEQEALGLFRRLDAQMRPLALGILRMLSGAQAAQRDAPLPAQAERAPPADTLSERLAQDLAREMESMAPEDQQRVFDLMVRLRHDPAARGAPVESEPS